MREALKINFQSKLMERSQALLDDIFADTEEVRNNITIKIPRPGREREVAFVFTYQSTDEAQLTLSKLTAWLADNNNFSKVRSLMLY